MLESNYTIQNYMQEIEPMVVEFQQGKVQTEMEKRLAHLKQESILCNDNLTIFQCWQDGIGRSLLGTYNDQSLLQIHGYPHAELNQVDTLYKIYLNNELIAAFHYCKHSIYTPVVRDRITHQCLKC